ncbi:hypothetical protein E2C01_011899 [Portunus trituberculatus]|uniref:Uncharacterized protein n=1 Tax=Portunus trituberculatus TaxID=210409 RepID=A0A5B7DD28_PORTR|nr:hypothetical protein [Portunus trituberculatus]
MMFCHVDTVDTLDGRGVSRERQPVGRSTSEQGKDQVEGNVPLDIPQTVVGAIPNGLCHLGLRLYFLSIATSATDQVSSPLSLRCGTGSAFGDPPSLFLLPSIALPLSSLSRVSMTLVIAVTNLVFLHSALEALSNAILVLIFLYDVQ